MGGREGGRGGEGNERKGKDMGGEERRGGEGERKEAMKGKEKEKKKERKEGGQIKRAWEPI